RPRPAAPLVPYTTLCRSDPDNQFGPTYATLAQRLDDAPLGEGELVTGRIERDGTVTEEPELAEYGIGFGTYVPETNHTVAAPFRSEEHTSELQSRDNLVC